MFVNSVVVPIRFMYSCGFLMLVWFVLVVVCDWLFCWFLVVVLLFSWLVWWVRIGCLVEYLVGCVYCVSCGFCFGWVCFTMMGFDSIVICC